MIVKKEKPAPKLRWNHVKIGSITLDRWRYTSGHRNYSASFHVNRVHFLVYGGLRSFQEALCAGKKAHVKLQESGFNPGLEHMEGFNVKLKSLNDRLIVYLEVVCDEG